MEGESHVLRDSLIWQQAEILENRAYLTAKLRDLVGRERTELLASNDDVSRRRLLFAQHQAQKSRLA